MKPWFLWVSCAGMLIPGACQFDRSPFVQKSNGASSERDAAVDSSFADATNDAAALADATANASGDGTLLDSGTDSEDGGDHHDADVPVDPGKPTGPNDPPPGMTGGLQCQGAFCPFAVDPAKPCCTTQTDVDRRTARAVDRCGLDLSPLMSAAYGDGCWQRDQLGIVDDRCPSVDVEQGMPPEPGCCTDDGQCGSLNSSQKLNCRHAPGTQSRDCNDTPSTSTCDPIGSFGTRITLDAAWGGRSGGLWDLTDDGRGDIQIYLLISLEGVDAKTHALKASGRVCGVTFPKFYSTTLCEAYQPIFPNTIWEAANVPKPELNGRYECSSAGCVLSIDPDTYLIGFELENPESPWPGADETTSLTCPSGKGGRCFPDDDSDGRPGVQVDLETSGRTPANATGDRCSMGYAFRGAPLSNTPAAIFNGVRRTDRLLLGARLKTGTSLRLSDDCNQARGSAVAEYVNSRAYGCLVEKGTFNWPGVQQRAGDNDVCESSEAEFLDTNLPEYKLLSAGAPPPSNLDLPDRARSRGPVTSILRLGKAGEAIDCETVRNAQY